MVLALDDFKKTFVQMQHITHSLFQLPVLLHQHVTLSEKSENSASAGPVQSLVLADANLFAVVQKYEITLLQGDFIKMKLTRWRSIRHDGLSYQKLLSVEPGVQLIVAQRDLDESKDIIQTVFLRVVFNLDFNPQELAASGDS